MQIALCIPALNPSAGLKPLLASIKQQTYQPSDLLVIDSGSEDDCTTYFRKAGFRVHQIQRGEFNHGGTRQLFVEMVPAAEIIVYLTQDVVLANPVALEKLLTCFADEKVAAAYGRQLPRRGAGPIEAHARLFNYPPLSHVRSIDDVPKFGIKTAFISNSFAAYRNKVLMSVGGFPRSVISTEDTYVAAKMLLAGWHIAYCAEAMVYHSHNYTHLKEFRRYFDIGIFYGREKWIRDAFGMAEGEGKRFVQSELKYMLRENAQLMPSCFCRTILKYLGYRIGYAERKLPLFLKKHLSMNKDFWVER